MKQFYVTGASALAMLVATPALAQGAQADDSFRSDEIIVTAQRQSQTLQEVPIAVSAFSAEALEKQQIENSSDLQLTLPNVTFTKGNFTGSSFTIRGIGDLCVGVTCDSATAIHVNDQPLLGTRLFETEFFDLERVEVLRGPQGTLYGRNATSGVINFITAKPDLTAVKGSGEVEYGNFNSIKMKGMLNLPVSDKLGVRVAGFYMKRDGYTENLYAGADQKHIDDRDMFAVRGSVRWEPTDTTRVDLMAYYFRENDSRMRIQKQMCRRDPTGVLGCLPGGREFETSNANSTLASILSSRELITVAFAPVLGPAAAAGAGAAYGLGSIYGPDALASFVNPANVRQVSTAFTPEYFTSEQQYSAHIEQDLGAFNIQLSGLYKKAVVDSRQDYNNAIQSTATMIPALTALAFTPSLSKVAKALIPNGPNGPYCISDTDPSGTGVYGGHSVCRAVPFALDRSNEDSSNYSVEAIIDSKFDGPFNFLIGGIFVDGKLGENSYYVNTFGLDYFAGVVGGLATGGAAFRAPPYYRNNTDDFRLKSKGLFGEAYYDISESVKFTVGLRYNHDKKYVKARTTLFSAVGLPEIVSNPLSPTKTVVADIPSVAVYLPHGATSLTQAAGYAGLDFDATRAGAQEYQIDEATFSKMTGRAVLDWKVSEDNLIYLSYSRGYKSGGINPPLSPIFSVPKQFTPEKVDSFELGSKNSFANGKFILNATAFYYKYKGLQLSRIVARTSVNDNIDADIYGLELESIIRPTRELAINIGASYLHTKVSSDKYLSNPRDPSGGRADAVVIKDLIYSSNCSVTPNVAGNVAGVNQFVGAVNSAIGLRAPTSFGANSGIAATGAYSICAQLIKAIVNPSAPLQALFGVNADGWLPFSVNLAGEPVNLKGKKLPQAPNYKFSAGAQYTAELSNGMVLTPRVDFAYTGDSYGNIFNGPVNKIKGYSQLNGQIQLNGEDDRWFLRGFVQNITNNNATTGLYVTDQSSGLFTNIFTLEPRRYGVAAGFKF